MSAISLPKKVVFENNDSSHAQLIIEPLYPGYGTTLGNVLRRVLLSSLHGAAVESMKIKAVDHEFSTIAHVKEDMIEIAMNVKRIYIKAHTVLEEPVIMRLKASGERVATAGDIEVPSDIEIANPDHVIATLTDPAAELEIDFTVSTGRGYVTVDQQQKDNHEVGVVALDTLYSPIIKVGMETKNVRVDKMTNYDSLLLDIETNGTRTPEEAVHEALDIVLEQFNHLRSFGSDTPETEEVGEDKENDDEENGEQDG